MAPLLLPVADLPQPGDLVWCKFPKRHIPDTQRIARPVVVRESVLLEHKTGYQFGTVTVTYGTDARNHGDRTFDFFLDRPDCSNFGLHKPTVFILDRNNTKTLLWRDDFFVAPEYIAACSVFIGYLSRAHMTELNRKASLPRP